MTNRNNLNASMEAYKIIPYEQLTLCNDYIFSKAMQNPELCKHLLEIILDIKIRKIKYPETQKDINQKYDAKSIRLDVYVEDDEDTVYDVEMQVSNPGNLPKRSRYYQSMIDINLINKGKKYRLLNKSFVIFICKSDIFRKNRHIYTFENLCVQDPSIRLGDETVKIFLNPRSTMDDVSEDLHNFLNYLVDGIVKDEYTSQLEKEVEEVRHNEEWRMDYMTLEMKFKEKLKEGIAIGEKIGIEEGLAQGMAQGELVGQELIIERVKELQAQGLLTMTEEAAEILLKE